MPVNFDKGLAIPTPAPGARIMSIGAARGTQVVDNNAIAGPIDSSDEWIRTRTGIHTRVRAGADQSLLDMVVDAGEHALAGAGISADEIDAVIVSTFTWMHQTPSLAALAAHRLGITGAPAWDISAACAGYCYAIAQADALIRAGSAHHVLVVGAEKMSEIIDPTDRTISFLLGDGAGAAVVGAADVPMISTTTWGADGSGWDLVGKTHSWTEWRDNPELGWPTLRQEGPSVFKWAVFTVTKYAKQAIAAAGLEPEDIDVFIPHQANLRIIEKMAQYLALREDVVIARDIVTTGNTSAASIPLAIAALKEQGAYHSGAIGLQIGFGAGLTHAAQVVVLP